MLLKYNKYKLVVDDICLLLTYYFNNLKYLNYLK